MNKFVQESISELKKIQWPSRKETLKLTAYVIFVSLGVAGFIMGFDYLFAELLKLLFTK